MTTPRLLVSIVNFRTPQHSIACLRSLMPERDSVPGLQVVVADGCSGDDSCAVIGEWIAREGQGDWISLLPLPRNGGFGWAHNQVMQRALQGDAPPDYIYLLNPDALVLPGSLRRLVEEMEADPRRGATGGLMYNNDNVLQRSAHVFPDWRSELASGGCTFRLASLFGYRPIGLPTGDAPREVDWVSGSNVMLRAQALRQCGLFDHGFFLYYEEIELMARMKRGGWTVWQTPHAGITHEGGAATKVSRDPAVRRRTPLPPYWYRSERRCLTLIHGRAGAAVAFWAWLVGRLFVGTPRRMVSATARANAVYRDLRNKWAAWREPAERASQPHVAQWSDPPGETPAWEAWN